MLPLACSHRQHFQVQSRSFFFYLDLAKASKFTCNFFFFSSFYCKCWPFPCIYHTVRERKIWTVLRVQDSAPRWLREKKKLCCLFNITFRFLVPGWRLGWVLIYDKNEAFSSEVSWTWFIDKMFMFMSCSLLYSNLQSSL